MEDLEKAKALLSSGNYTCVVCKGDQVRTSAQRGVAPLLFWLDEPADLMGWSAADRVVGKGAAMLYCLLGVRRVYGQIMSVAAMKVFRANGIEASYGTLAEYIRNRAKNGVCPIEAACLGYEEPEEALAVIRRTLEKLKPSP